MTWEYLTNETSVIQLPMLVQTNTYTFDVAYTPESEMINAFLYTDDDYDSIVQAKLSTQINYRYVESYSFTPSCFLGTLAASVGVTINFKVIIPEDSDLLGEMFLPIKIGYGSNITAKYSDGENPFWRRDSSEDPFFWNPSDSEISWFNGS
jgi:hypothetical protein